MLGVFVFKFRWAFCTQGTEIIPFLEVHKRFIFIGGNFYCCKNDKNHFAIVELKI